MSYNFRMPAVRGKQCQREYFTVIVPFGLIPKLFYYNEDFVPAAIRSQRELNEKRVPEIANYILYNDDWVFSSLTATVNGDIKFLPFDGSNPDIGILEVDMNAVFLINDGQHRRAAIIEAMKQNPELHKESISVVIYRFEGVERSNQMFADLNRYAQKPSKSLNVLYDSRDPLAHATSEMLRSISIFERFTDKDRVSLALKSPKLFTLGSLYEANKNLLRMNKKKMQQYSPENTTLIIDFWQEVVKCMLPWQLVQKGELKTWELREEYICSHSVIIQALGMTGSYLLENKGWKKKLAALEKIDWRRENVEWKGIAIAGNGRVVNSKPAVHISSVFIREKIGLSLSQAEQKELESAHWPPELESQAKGP
jgi:DNA sulfur modification protein DndB